MQGLDPTPYTATVTKRAVTQRAVLHLNPADTQPLPAAYYALQAQQGLCARLLVMHCKLKTAHAHLSPAAASCCWEGERQTIGSCLGFFLGPPASSASPGSGSSCACAACCCSWARRFAASKRALPIELQGRCKGRDNDNDW
jgi:hypothetical protein